MLRKLIGISFASMLMVAPVAADTLDDVIDAGTLKCGVVLDFPPIGYFDANNEPAGFDVEYCNDLAAALEVDVEI
ncbi:MAG: transporter substrate-binding domain-containing protein, partial [Alphaproteobacteria bacterium]